MDNQHRKIAGYRELSQDEIDAMNEIKTLASGVGGVIDRLNQKTSMADQRWVNIAKTQLQQGFMALTRAIAQPTTF